MKLNRRQLRRLIESVINESEPGGVSRSDSDEIYADAIARGEIPPPYTEKELEEQVRIGVNVFNKVLKDGGYHPECHAVPSNMSYPQDERIHFFVKCDKGSEDAIINYLTSQEDNLVHPKYDSIEHMYSIERPGRIRVEIATWD